MRAFVHRGAAGAVAAVVLLTGGRGGAAPCTDLTADGQDRTIPILWIENGDTQEPLLKRLGKRLIQTAGQKVRIVYRNRPTCELAQNFYTTRSMTAVAQRPIRYIPEDPAFDPITGVVPQCEPPSSPTTVMLAIGATFLTSCPTLPATPADTAVVDGPNQAYGFIANKTSAQIAITAEEGYFAWGFTGGTGQASPWLDQELRFTRGATASTTLTCSANIGLTASQMLVGAAPPTQTSLLTVTNVQQAPDAQAALGALGADLYDQNRDKVKMLAFKAFDQRYAYFPDSTATSFDKQNVRDGHYSIWSPTPYVYEKNGAGEPADALVARFVGLVFGQRAEADVDGLRAVADSGLVPQCAMNVKRAFDGGDLSLFEPAEPCGCFFEQSVPNGSTTCAACTDDGACGAGKCRLGYCEVR